MFKPLSLFIGLRYLRAKRRNQFISFITLASMVGIMLGVMVLITVLSVMNGFDREIQKRVFNMVPAITINDQLGEMPHWQTLQQSFKDFGGIKASAPFVASEVLLSNDSIVQPALMMGILPNEEKHISHIAEKMQLGNLKSLRAQKFGIILGENLAQVLHVGLRDTVTVITPTVSVSPLGVNPRFKRFTVVGIFRAGNGFGFDKGLGFVHLQDAQKLLALDDRITGIHFSIDNVYHAPQLAERLANVLPPTMIVTTWVDEFGEFFRAIQLEKNMMFLILLLIIAVAVFNLVSTLVMVVNEKQADIAILRTYGATPRMIMTIFIVQGGCIGIFGTLLGVLGGLLLASHVTGIVEWIQQLFHVQFLSSSVYFVNYLPSHIELKDVLEISIASLCLSLLATIYPAWHAAQLNPVESLRYE